MRFQFSPSVFFRTATPDDIDAIMRIEDESFVDGLREDRDLYLKRIAVFSNGFLVAQDQTTGEIGGYISSEIWNEDQSVGQEVLSLGHNPENVHHDDGTQLYITSFGTLASWRGRKIGSALLKTLEEKIARDFPKVSKKVLIVSERWLPARHIYEKCGFKETGRIINFFEPRDAAPEDAILMIK